MSQICKSAPCGNCHFLSHSLYVFKGCHVLCRHLTHQMTLVIIDESVVLVCNFTGQARSTFTHSSLVTLIFFLSTPFCIVIATPTPAPAPTFFGFFFPSVWMVQPLDGPVVAVLFRTSVSFKSLSRRFAFLVYDTDNGPLQKHPPPTHPKKIHKNILRNEQSSLN